jgi:hypothetical protein
MTSINLKIDLNSKIKRIRDLPQTIEALRSVVDCQLDPPRAPKKDSYSIQYRDGQDDVINVSDDEDLLTAYEVAQKELQGNLKLHIAMISTAEEEKKDAKKPKAKKTVKDPSKKKTKKSAATKTAGDSDDIQFIEERAQTICQPQSTNLGNILESDTPSTEREEDDEEREDQAVQTNSAKGSSTKTNQLPPRNAIKKLIQKELEKHAPQIF